MKNGNVDVPIFLLYLKHAEQQIVAWIKTRDALKAEITTLEKAYNSSPENVNFD
jgi:hypothetical protein